LDAQKESTKENGTLPYRFAKAGNPMPPIVEFDVSSLRDQPFFSDAIIKERTTLRAARRFWGAVSAW
jgi:hypothetical protein